MDDAANAKDPADGIPPKIQNFGTTPPIGYTEAIRAITIEDDAPQADESLTVQVRGTSKARKRDLAPMELRFIGYMTAEVGMTPIKAAVLAGYRSDTAAPIASYLMKDPKIRGAIIAGRAEFGELARVDPIEVLNEIKSVAFANITDFVSWDDDGLHFTPSHMLSREMTAAITQITQTFDKNGRPMLQFKLADKMSALTMLGKHLGLLVDRTEVSGPNGSPLGVVIIPCKMDRP